MMQTEQIKQIIEGALLAAGRPVKLDQLEALFQEHERPEKQDLREAIQALQADYEDRAMELVEVGNGFRIQVRQSVSDWVSRLWEERPSRYSRALLETLALVAYRQPITRSEIEEVRGVSVSTSIIRTLQERGWIKVVGHRDVPGRPAMFGTTREFLDYFNLKSLDELPSLAEIRDIDSINVELELDDESQSSTQTSSQSPDESSAEPSQGDEPDETAPAAESDGPSSEDDAETDRDASPEGDPVEEALEEASAAADAAAVIEQDEDGNNTRDDAAEVTASAEPTDTDGAEKAMGAPRQGPGEGDAEEGEQAQAETEDGRQDPAEQASGAGTAEEDGPDREGER